ncbi:MBL fold metallo-hydrolase [Mycolicibacterium sp.]|uniref:MBL fold metallo-hydrolase n=1 Tax=Mycolicibacterium sp. TaxID=2320850 RepID=UPI0028AE2C82|nr:MBL fold metallo-hydrolase [Mycolicibacterium sp.]
MQDTAAPRVIPLDSSGLGDRSYIAHDGSTALVVDPQRDFDRIDELLAEHGLRLTHVAETHIHNDYVTGGLELARRHGATYVIPGGVEVSYEALAVCDGDSFTVGEMTVDVIHTPGHTPHHVSFAVRTSDHPGAVFTGGSLLYGSVGRPDLVAPDMAVKQAHDQWHSVRRLADTLDDETPIYPTHGFGSFCAATQAQGLSSTIGNEKTINPALTEAEEEFVTNVLAGLDVFPAYYAHMGPINAAGPRDVELSIPEHADPAVLRERINRGEWVVDLRSRKVFAAGHVPGALNFDLDGAFINYLAWMMPWGTPVTLLGSTPEQVHAAHRELVRVGIDNAVGQASGGPQNWLEDPAAAQRLEQVDFHGLAAVLSADKDVFVLDTRQILEWEDGHVAQAVFMPFYEIADRLAEIPRDKPVYVYCGSGYRAAAVASLLQHNGFSNIVAVDDDFSNAAAADLTLVAEDAPAREPGWTWIASRAAVREFSPRSAADTRS